MFKKWSKPDTSTSLLKKIKKKKRERERAYSSSNLRWKGSESREVSPRLTGDGSDVAASMVLLGEPVQRCAEPHGLNQSDQKKEL